LPGFSGAAAASAGPGFADVPFPSGSIAIKPKQTTGGTGSFTITELDACSPNTSANAVRSFFTQQLVGANWKQSSLYPYNVQYEAWCGAPYGWTKGAAPRLVSLEKVTDQGNSLVTYHVRLAKPPTVPNCPSSPFGSKPYATFVPNSDIPLPPLSLFGP